MKRNTLILAGMLVLLVIAAFLVLERPGERSVASDSGAMLVSYDSAAISKIEIRSGAERVILQREGSGWMLTSPLRAKADDAGIHQILSKAKTIAMKALISSNPEKQSLFQIDSTGTLVKLYEGETERAAFRIGKPGSSYTESYVRREGSNDVYLTDGMLTYTFVKPPRDWRDKAITRLPQESIKNVRFQYGDTTFTMAFQDSVWRIDGAPVNEYAARNLVSSLATLNADDFIDSTIAAPPRLTAVIDIEGTQLRFHKNPQADKYFVIASNHPQVYEMQGWHAAQVLKRKKELLTTPQ
jgi:hypothetical protein